MKSIKLQDALTDIDDELIENSNVRKFAMKKQTIMKLVAGVAAAGLVAAALVIVPHITGTTKPTEGEVDGPAGAGGIDGKINLREDIKVLGEEYAFTDEEGAAYLEKVTDSIRSDLKASGVETTAFRIMKKGYAHVRTGDHGNEIAVNWRDYLAYDGDTIVAQISLTKDEQGLRHFLAWGSPCYPEMTEMLQDYRGEEVVFLYVGDCEAFLTKDGGIHSFASLEQAIEQERAAEYYAFFKRAENTYIPE